MPRPIPLIAATSTMAMVRTAQARGVDTDDLLAAAGLSLAHLEDPDARIPAPTALSIWSALRQRTGDPALQLAAPATLPFGAYRVIDYLVGASATVGAGIECFVRFFGLIANAVVLTVERSDDGRCLRLDGAGGTVVPSVYVDYVFAALVTRIRMRVRPALQLRRVELRQPQPAAAAPYTAVFDAPVHFGATSDRLCFTDAEWNAATLSPDAALAALLEEHARILVGRAPARASDFCARVQDVIAAAPGAGGDARVVARALHVSVRTLQRRLVESGTCFRDMADRVRAQIALGYLADPKVSIAEVAVLLGFSEQRSFNRAFHRWTGESPGRWRRGRRAIAAPVVQPPLG